MANNSIIQKVMSFSFHFEMIIRRIYWSKFGIFIKNKFKTINERRPKWGKLHFAERLFAKDLLNDNIMKSDLVDGLLIESLKAKKLYNYMNSKNKYGYPYFWLKKQSK